MNRILRVALAAVAVAVAGALAVLAVVVLRGSGESRSLTEASASQLTTTTPSTDPPTTTTTEPPTTTTTEPPTTTTEAPTTTTEPPPPPPPPEGDVLEAGMVGPRTEVLQQRLVDLHFDPGTVDGEFGTRTTQAVWAFQHSHGYEADGVVTPELYDAIMNAGDPEPLVPEGGPTRTVISLDRQALYLYRDGALVLVTHISTGTGKRYCEDGGCGVAVTPRGDFVFERRISGWRESRLGLLYNPIYFVGGIAVHGAKSVPNHPASHGCVRIPMHIAEYFPALVNNGEPVFVI